jgi:hypothetical protein
MSSSDAGENRFEVHNSSVIAQAFLRLQRRAARQGRGKELHVAAQEVYRQLRRNPTESGEPLYRLPVMRMQVRCVVVRPLAVDFAVCEDQPLVFIKAVRLLSKQL